ncbi:hypothetical protein AM587_10003214 [Phytophthora nicotianae]|uniref:Uncharacterized protein n=1 Tax=Phytophthora nicotianae TaxID=4792 RepID=A0A0W8CLV7_PHYNI|nr:hypothetical protein AM587_10003214 [Phytophthora nicotianae]
MGILELAKDGQHTSNEVIKKATQTVYESSFKKFSDFCIANGYPDPRHERHHELPVILVAYLQNCLAPDKTYLHGCPSAPYEAAKNTEEGPVLKRLRRLENLMLEMKAQITTLAAPSTPSPSASAQDDAEDHTEEELEPAKSSVIPAVQDWAHLCLMWWIPDKSLHLFKPLSKWTLAERTKLLD